MDLRRAILLLAPAWLLAQPREPKPKPSDYPVHKAAPKLTLAAEYMVQSFAAGNQTFVIPEHLVVEVAVYPAKGEVTLISSGQFTLRLNGKKEALLAQPPQFVAAALKYSDWTRRPTLVGQAGAGDVDVIINRPRPAERFPGDDRERRNRLPAPPKAPPPADSSGVDKPASQRPEELVVQAALPEGETALPVAGYLYFPFKGKTRNIRTVELLYQGPSGPLTLRFD